MREWHQKIVVYSFSLSYYFIACLCFVSTSFWRSPPPSLFNWPCAQLYLKVSYHTYVLRWYIIHCLIIYFGFIECLYMHLFWHVFGRNSGVKQNLKLGEAWVKAWVKRLLHITVTYISHSPSQIHAEIPSHT